MSKKNVIGLVIMFGVASVLYFYLYRDSFRKANIQIAHTFRPNPRARDAAADVIIFRLPHDYRLTSVKVVSIPELTTNQYAHPLWELLSDSNSVPIQTFTYGGRIGGMHTTVKGAQPAELAFNTPYRLLVEAGSVKGRHDFIVADEKDSQ